MITPELRLEVPLVVTGARSTAPRTGIKRQLRASTALRQMLRATAWSGVSIAMVSAASANPTGGAVVSGQATINQSNPNRTEITQTTDRAAINWQSFNIGAKQSVVINQPSSSSWELERVIGPDPSTIAGRLSSNGNVALVNPNGLFFSRGSQIDVHGLVATTADIRDRDFNDGRFNFSIPSPNANARVVNEGTITVADHGLAALVAPGTANSGTITAKFGHVMLAGAQTFTVDLYGDGLISFDVTSKVKGANVTNTGKIEADGGVIQLSASTVDDIVTGVVNMGGAIAADSVGAKTGTITADAGANGQLNVSGQVSAQGANAGETGGSIALTGGNVSVGGTATIDASGSAGGGSIKVGGGFHGSDSSIANAQTTTIAAGAVLDASAVDTGDGGKVAVWSDKATAVHGTIRAKGGAKGGHGGFVETSSHGHLDIAGAKVDTSAPAGAAGTWLLDPDSVTISGDTDANEQGTGTFADPFVATDTTAASTLNVTDIQNGLKTGGNVLVQTSNGDIDVAATITAPAGSGNLGLKAGGAGNIVIGSGATAADIDFSASTTGSVFLQAGGTIGQGAGGGTIKMGGGVLQLAAGAGIGTPTTGVATTGVTTLAASTGTGGVAIANTASDITVGQISVDATGNIGGTAAAPFNTVTGVTATSGDIALKNAGSITVSRNVTATAGNVSLTTTSGGNVNLAAAVSGGAVAVHAAGLLTLGGTTALNLTGSGGVTLEGTGVTLAQNVTTNGVTSINAGTGAYTDGGNTLSTSSNNLSLTATTLALTAATTSLDSGTAATTITAAPGEGLSIGAGKTATTLGIADGTLDLIHAGGGVTLATTATSDITVDGKVTNHAGFTALTLNSGGNVNINNDIAYAGATAESLAATADGNIAVNANITSAHAPLQVALSSGTAGGVTLQANTKIVTDGGNLSIAAGTGGIGFNSNNTLDTTSAGGGGNLSLTAPSLTVDGTLNAGSGTGAGSILLDATAGAVTQAPSSGISAQGLAVEATDNSSLLSANNSVATFAANVTGHGLSFANTAGFAVGTVTVGPTTVTGVTTSGAFPTDHPIVLTAGNGGATVAANTLTLAANVDTSGSGVQTSNVTLQTLAGGNPGGNIVAPEPPAAGGIVIATNLSVNSAGLIDLAQPNQVNTLSASAAKGIAFRNRFGLTIASLTAGDDSALLVGGPLTLTGNVNVGPTHNLLLTSTSDHVTEAGPAAAVTANGLLVNAEIDIDLEGANNHVAALATTSPHGVAFNDATALTVGTVAVNAPALGGTLSGVSTTASGDIALRSAGSIVLNKDVRTAAGNVFLEADGLGATITTTGGGVSLAGAGSLSLLANAGIGTTGAIAVSDATGVVTLAAQTATGGVSVAADASGLTIGAQAAPPAGFATITGGGVSSNSGDVVLQNTGAITVDNAINSGTQTGAIKLLADTGQTGTALTINAAVGNAATGAVTLSGDSITENLGGTITAGKLTGTSGGDVLLANSNAVGDLGAFALTAGNFNLNDGTTALTIDGAVKVPGTLTLNAGTITELAGGTITAGTLSGSTPAGIVDLSQSGNAIANLGDFTTTTVTNIFLGIPTIQGADFTLADGTPLAVSGAVSTAGGGLFGTSGNLSLTATSLSLAGSLNAGSAQLSLVAKGAGGAISESSTGAINAGTLTGSSNAGNVGLDQGTNTIGTLAGFTTGGGDFSFTDGTALNVSSLVSTAGGNLSLTVPGLTLGVLPTSLDSASGKTTITALGEQMSVGLGTSGGLGITDAELGQVNAGGGLTLATQAGQRILVDGDITTHLGFSSLALQSGGNIDLSGNITVAALALNSPTGAITQNNGIITAGTLTGTSGGNAFLFDGNTIATLGSFASGGSFELLNNGLLTVDGPVSAGNNPGNFLELFSGSLTLTNRLTANEVALVATDVGGAISQTGGAINAATLVAESNGGKVTLTQPNNAISAVSFMFTGGGDFSLADSSPLVVNGSINVGAGAIALNGARTIDETNGTITAASLSGSSGGNALLTGAGNQIGALGAFQSGGNLSLSTSTPLSITGAVTVPGILTFNASGITEQAAASITAGALAGTSSGNVVLSNANNSIANVGPFNITAGSFNLVDARALTVSGAVNAASGNLSLGVTGPLAVAADLTAAGTVTLTSTGTITQTGGSISANALNGGSVGGTALNDANHIENLTGFTNAGAGGFSLTDAQSLTVGAAAVNAGSGDLALHVTGALGIGANLTAGNAVTLDATGAITQSAGTLSGTSVALTAGGAITQSGAAAITAATLTGSAGGDALFFGNNSIDTLGSFTTPGTFFLGDLAALTVAGPVTAGNGSTAILEILDTHGITLAGDLSAGGIVAIGAEGGPLTQTGGAITTNMFEAISAGGATLAQPGNQFSSVVFFENVGAGDVLIKDKGPLMVGGTFSNSGGRFTIQANGAMTLGAGTFDAGGGVELGAPGVMQTGNVSFSAQTPLVVIDTTGATLPQAVNPTSAATLLSSFEPGSASGNISLTNFSAPNASVLLAANAGAITGTAITARNLAVLGANGSAQLFGNVGGIAGSTAAQVVGKSGRRENAYRFNNCAIGSITCTVLPTIVPAKPAPVSNVSILAQQQFTDPLINLLNVGDEDLY